MSDPDGFDSRLAARFDQEHRQVPADDFVATTMRNIRAGRRRGELLRTGLLVAASVAALVAAVVVSPWLNTGIVRLNAALEFSIAWAMGQPAAWALGALAVVAVVAMRLRSR